MSTTNGNLTNLKVTDPQGNVYVLVPVDAEARQAIEEAKELSFDEDYFTVEESDTEVHFGLNGVPIGVDDATPLKIIQDNQEGFVLGADTLFTSSLIGSTFTDFSSASTYDVDQKVVHNSKLYNCTTAVSVAGVWNDANWTEIPLIDLANQYTLSAIQDLATKEYVDSLVVSSVSAAASISYVSVNYVNNTTFNAYSTDVANQLATLSANKLDKTDFNTYSADIASQLSDKLDTSDFNTYSAAVDERFDDKLDVSAVSSFDVEAYSGSDNISVQDHIISLQNTKNLIGDGTSLAVLETDSAFVVSAVKDFADKTYVTSAVSGKLDKTQFNSYSASVANQFDTKLDTSVFNAYSADIDSQLNDKLDITQFNSYSAVVDSQFDTKLDVSAVSSFDVETYSGSENVSVQDHIISLQNTKNLIGDGTSITVLETDSAFVVSATKDFADKTYVTSAVSGKLDKTQFNSYSATVANQFTAKLDTSDFNTYSAAIDSQLDDKLDASAVSSFDVEAYSGSNNISVQDHVISLQNTKNLIGDGTSLAVVETDSAFVVSATKDFADKTFVTSAVSGKLNTSDFNTYSATVDTQLAAKVDISAVSAKIDGIASPANLGGFAAPTKIMVVSAMPAAADIDATTIYFVVGTMTGN